MTIITDPNEARRTLDLRAANGLTWDTVRGLIFITSRRAPKGYDEYSLCRLRPDDAVVVFDQWVPSVVAIIFAARQAAAIQD